MSLEKLVFLEGNTPGIKPIERERVVNRPGVTGIKNGVGRRGAHAAGISHQRGSWLVAGARFS